MIYKNYDELLRIVVDALLKNKQRHLKNSRKQRLYREEREISKQKKQSTWLRTFAVNRFSFVREAVRFVYKK